MLAKNKKGISEIVVTIIINLLAIVVFAVVSVVVKGTVSSGAENIELSANCLDVEMHAVKIAQTIGDGGNVVTDQYDVTVSRSSSGKNLNGIKIILEDVVGENSYNSKDIIKDSIKPLDKFTEPGIVFSGATFVKENAVKVTVIPFFMKKSGEVYYCENTQVDELIVQ